MENVFSQQTVYWVEMENENDVNGTLYMSNIGGGDKINFFDEFDTGMVGSPSAIAFDWIGRNLYILNQVQTIYMFVLKYIIFKWRGDDYYYISI